LGGGSGWKRAGGLGVAGGVLGVKTHSNFGRTEVVVGGKRESDLKTKNDPGCLHIS